jgi:hypothetical protein
MTAFVLGAVVIFGSAVVEKARMNQARGAMTVQPIASPQRSLPPGVTLVPAAPPGFELNPAQGEPPKPKFDVWDVAAMRLLLEDGAKLESRDSCDKLAVGYFRECMPDELVFLYEEALRRRLVPDPRIGWKGAAYRDRWDRAGKILARRS